MKNLLIIMLFMITLMGCGETDEVTPETLVEQGVVTEDAIVKPFYGTTVICKLPIGEQSLTIKDENGYPANLFKLILLNKDTLSFYNYGSFTSPIHYLKGQIIIYKTEFDVKYNKFILYLEAADNKDLSKRVLYKYKYQSCIPIKH